jgi:hypothetical protein
MKTILIFITGLTFYPLIVNSAEFTCVFATRCSESSECTPKDLGLTVFHEGDFTKIETPGLTFDVVERVDIVNGSYSYVTGMQKNTTHLLTIFANGEARFTAHTFLKDAISFTYIGICSELAENTLGD